MDLFIYEYYRKVISRTVGFRIESSSSKNVRRSASTGNKLSVLVVDDDPVVQRIHSVFVRRFGMETQVVGNGKEAVALYRSGASFHLILMDMEMPLMDGPRETRELRAMGVNSMIVGLTSCDGDSEKHAIFMGAGLDACHAKPLTAATITSLLQELDKNH